MAKHFHHPSVDQINLDRVLHALSDPLRRSIVAYLMDSPHMSCRKTCDAIAPSTLSFHFRILREAGLVRSEKNGTEVNNTLRLKDVEARFPKMLRTILKYHEPYTTTPKPTTAKPAAKTKRSTR